MGGSCESCLEHLRHGPTPTIERHGLAQGHVEPGVRGAQSVRSHSIGVSLRKALRKGREPWFTTPLAHCAGKRLSMEACLAPTIQREFRSAELEATDTCAQALARCLRRRIEKGSKHLSGEAERTFLLAEYARNDCINSFQELRDYAGLSRRQCERNFLRWIGIRPKQFLELHRLQRTLHRLRQRPGLVVATGEQGYADQSHMARTVKRLTGLTPKRGRRLPSVMWVLPM